MSSAKDLPQSVTASSLRSLAEDKTEGVTKQTTFQVDPDLVEFEPGFNVRSEDDTLAAHIDRLYAAMKEGAAVPPIDVRVSAGKIICVDGYCRTTAAKRLREEIPAYRLQARQFQGNEQDRVIHMLGTGSGQKPLTPLEQGIGFLRLMRYGMTQPEIAAKLGISRVTVDNNLTLAEAPVEVQQMVRDGEVSSTTAREAIKQGPEGIEALKDAVAEEKAKPSTTKNGAKSKKKNVTAKKLIGTAAAKKAKPAKVKKGHKTVAEWNKELGMTIAIPVGKDSPVSKKFFLSLASANTPAQSDTTAPDEIAIKVKKDAAQAAASFIRANAPTDDPILLEFAAALEMALL